MSPRPFPLSPSPTQQAAAVNHGGMGTPSEGVVVKITGLTSAATQPIAHGLGRTFQGMAVSKTNPAGKDKYLYQVDANKADRFVTFGTLTAATYTYYALVY